MEDLEKQIEEAAKEYSNGHLNNGYYTFLDGVKSEVAKEYWQQGMYSEKEVVELLMKFDTSERVGHFNGPYTRDKWFEQNKKNKALSMVNSHG